MPKHPPLSSLPEAELSALVTKLHNQLNTLGQAYASDPEYRRLIKQAETRRKAIAAKNSGKYYVLARQHQAAEEALAQTTRANELAKEANRVRAIATLPARIRVWYVDGGFARRKVDVVWTYGDAFVLVRKPGGKSWQGVGMGQGYVPVTYVLYDLQDTHARELWRWEGRLDRQAMHNVQSVVSTALRS